MRPFLLFSAMVFGTVVAASGQVKRPMTFEDLQQIKRVADPQVSPSGKWVMFSATSVDLATNKKTTHLYTVPVDGSAKEKAITAGKDGETGGRFSPDGKQVLFLSSNEGSQQIYLAPWDEQQGVVGPSQKLTNISTEADGAIWSPKGNWIAFVSDVYPECAREGAVDDACNKTKDDAAAKSPVKAQIWDGLLYRHWDHYQGLKRSHILLVSADGKQMRDLTPTRDIKDHIAPTFSLGGPIGYAFSPDEKELAYVVNMDEVPAASTNNDIYTVDLTSSSGKPVKVTTSPGSDDGPAYSPDGKYLAFRSQARPGYESDRFRLMLYDREKKTATEAVRRFDNWVDEFTWSPDSKRIYFASGSEGQEPVFAIDVDGPAAGEAKDIVHGAEFSSLALTPDGKTLIAAAMKVDRPAGIVSLTAAGPSDHYSELSKGNEELIHSLELPAMESFKFPGAGGTSVQGFIIRPPNFDSQKKYPLKFLIHGGPQGAWGDMWSYRWNPELFAANGYVVVMINPRGSTGYGQAFIDGVNGDWGGKPYIDLMKGLDYAEAHYPFIDKDRECALGASYGGFMANWILTHNNRFKCIVTHDGMYNPQSAYGSTEEMWFNEWEFRRAGDKEPGQPWRYALLPAARDPFRKWSPMLNIKNAKTPTLVVHSQKDYRLDVSEGFQLFTALQRLKVPSKMLYFPDEGHWVLKPQNSRLWYQTVNDWCDRWTYSNAYAK
ncbi:S9 family peptidase [Terriglobus albidus]|uniref:S9 family peptidase n=1 Tax=Terriglobus albidus TaxID=1592106 RepID=UPI0021DFCEC8|nr:S9 family peptidase [Terriglobus albidus]